MGRADAAASAPPRYVSACRRPGRLGSATAAYGADVNEVVPPRRRLCTPERPPCRIQIHSSILSPKPDVPPVGPAIRLPEACPKCASSRAYRGRECPSFPGVTDEELDTTPSSPGFAPMTMLPPSGVLDRFRHTGSRQPAARVPASPDRGSRSAMPRLEPPDFSSSAGDEHVLPPRSRSGTLLRFADLEADRVPPRLGTVEQVLDGGSLPSPAP